jgi:hypothetical protein
MNTAPLPPNAIRSRSGPISDSLISAPHFRCRRCQRAPSRSSGFDEMPAGGPRVAAATNLPRLPGFGPTIVGVYGHNWLRGVDDLIDYSAKRIVMGALGTLPLSAGGHRTALAWAEGLPAVAAEVRCSTGRTVLGPIRPGLGH